jgi:hypothetical protein
VIIASSMVFPRSMASFRKPRRTSARTDCAVFSTGISFFTSVSRYVRNVVLALHLRGDLMLQREAANGRDGLCDGRNASERRGGTLVAGRGRGMCRLRHDRCAGNGSHHRLGHDDRNGGRRGTARASGEGRNDEGTTDGDDKLHGWVSSGNVCSSGRGV